MSTYRNGFDFERALFGKDSSKRITSQEYRRNTRFSEEALLAIKNREVDCPNTKIAKSLHFFVSKGLANLGISSEGLIFIPTLDTVMDTDHFTDALFYLPSLPFRVVTIDAFIIRENQIVELKDLWIDSFEGEYYTLSNFQTDLYSYKEGLRVWLKSGRPPSELVDYRLYSKSSRPENHFVITPYNVSNYRRRREFGQMVAQYFHKEAMKQ